MDFSYDKLGGVPSGDAYARLIEDLYFRVTQRSLLAVMLLRLPEVL